VKTRRVKCNVTEIIVHMRSVMLLCLVVQVLYYRTRLLAEAAEPEVTVLRSLRPQLILSLFASADSDFDD